MARCVASRSTTNGREVAWNLAAVMPFSSSRSVSQAMQSEFSAWIISMRLLAPRRRQRIEHLAVGELDVVVGHVDLERGVALGDQGREILAHDLLAGVGQDHMEGVVDQRLAVGALVIAVDHVAQPLAAALVGEGDDGGGAAGRRRPAAALEIVAEHRAVGGVLVEMDMGVDAARHGDQAGGVDLLLALVQPLAQGHDPAGRDADIALHHVCGGRNGGVADHEIILGHVVLPGHLLKQAACRSALSSSCPPPRGGGP